MFLFAKQPFIWSLTSFIPFLLVQFIWFNTFYWYNYIAITKTISEETRGGAIGAAAQGGTSLGAAFLAISVLQTLATYQVILVDVRKTN